MLKFREEVIANEYASSPLKYYCYLKKRFHGHPRLTKKLEKVWSVLQRPYVQSDLGMFLRGRKPKQPSKKS